MKYVNLSKNSEIKKRIERSEQDRTMSISPNQFKKSTKKRGKKSKVFGVIIIFLIIAGISSLMFGNKVSALFNPVSIIATINNAQLNETDGRTNILILGSDKRESGALGSHAILTDTLLIASIGRVENDVVLISLPRDLWVETSQGYLSKINAVYANGGSEEVRKVVSNVLGIPIHYYVVVNFDLFVDTVDALGGIEVDVENSFTDRYYPIEGKENAPLNERYETVTFEQGLQMMDGEKALKYARSRKGNNNEGTDFARAARQQRVIKALKEKALSITTIVNPSKLKELYDAYETNVDTDITFTDVQNFYLLSQQIDLQDIKSIVLDDRSAAENGGLLYAPEDNTLYGGAYVLIPRHGNFSQIHAYVQRYVFGD